MNRQQRRKLAQQAKAMPALFVADKSTMIADWARTQLAFAIRDLEVRFPEAHLTVLIAERLDPLAAGPARFSFATNGKVAEAVAIAEQFVVQRKPS